MSLLVITERSDYYASNVKLISDCCSTGDAERLTVTAFADLASNQTLLADPSDIKALEFLCVATYSLL
jgi:hypothetical protein